ncbi:transposable element-derived 1-like [Octopus vulgaris]|uniref:Transposable element-derived 1-like n=1 Tax=Octopus vulgaris TaxID=6645 RepID=A0AA36ATT8_OCTVU|nr:transposable element-derived 1-like [Octopus vulgaris]
MPPKRHTPSKASGNESKCQKKVMTFHEKVQRLDMLQEGKSYAAVSRCYDLKESTIRYIEKNESHGDMPQAGMARCRLFGQEKEKRNHRGEVQNRGKGQATFHNLTDICRGGPPTHIS